MRIKCRICQQTYIQRIARYRRNIDFLAKIDQNDIIKKYYLYIYEYDTNVCIVNISQARGDQNLTIDVYPDDRPSFSVDLSEYQDNFPINENNEFKLSISNLQLEKKKYYWLLRLITDNNYDVWISDGEIQSVSGTNIKIFPNTLINTSYHKIYDNYGDESTYSIASNCGYYDESTTASKIFVSASTTTIQFAKPLPNPGSNTDLYVTIDTTEYKVSTTAFGNGSTISSITVTGVHPLASTDVFGQYINVYRKYMTLTLSEQIFTQSGEEFSIYSKMITSNMNYFTTINRKLSFNEKDKDGNEKNEIEISSVVRSFSATYSGKVSWHQFELFRGGEMVDKTEKIYSNKLNYQYNNFYTDIKETPRIYTLKLKVHDVENCTYEKSLIIKAKYYRDGTSDKLKAFWDEERKAIKLDLSEFVSSEAILYKNGKKVKVNEDVYKFVNKDETTKALYVTSGSKIEYKEKTEGTVEFPRSSNMLIKLKLDENFNGSVFDFGNKTFAIQDYNVFVFDRDNNANVYSNTNAEDELIGSPYKDMINTQYYLNVNATYNFDETIFKYSDVLSSAYWYVLISQEGAEGTVTIWFDNKEYDVKSMKFNKFNGNIDGLSLYGGVTYENIKVSSSSIEESDPWVWDNGTYFLTKYNDGQINVSNTEAFPLNAQADDILVYKRCNLLGQDSQFLYVGSYPYNLKVLYDYSVADGHEYTYYIIKTYKSEDNNYEALAEIISQTIVPDYYEIDIFGTDYKLSNIDKNMYVINPQEKWYFELDAKCDSVNFVSEQNIYSSNQFAKLNKTNVNYMQGSVTAKLGNLQQEVLYTGDNRHTLERFKEFSNSLNAKIIRLKDGMVVPVDIVLKQKTNQSNLIGNPTDITFDWYQIADAETAILVEYEV